MNGSSPALEGAIKFEARHSAGQLEASRFGDLVCQLVAWREILARTGLVGQDAALYGGYAYGNVSGRVGPFPGARRERGFVVSGSGTSGKPRVALQDFCLVTRCDPQDNRVTSRGACLPSSESLTHGAIYDLAPHIRFVFHVHSPTIWRRARDLRLPTTEASAPYGSPEMAREVERLYRASTLAETGILAMGGHEDGVVVFGRTAEEAGQVVLRYLARAYEAECRV
jgi:ribulose-5-phosphate 4-epimerase/fuculose-1-phosphate aldolase